MEGDTIVVGSDGLFDNVFDHEIAPTVANKDVSEAGIVLLLYWSVWGIVINCRNFTDSRFILLLAKALANLAKSHSMDSNFDSPYSLEARSKVKK